MDTHRIRTMLSTTNDGFDVYLNAHDLIVMLLDVNKVENDLVKGYRTYLAQEVASVISNTKEEIKNLGTNHGL